MPNRVKAQDTAQGNDNVVPLFLPEEPQAEPLTSAEIHKLREFMQEFAIIRATCPMAVRALSKS